jgi:hypothetical protein
VKRIAVSSRAALIRAFSTPNVVIRVVDHWQEQLRGTTRTPEKVQGNGYYFRAADSTGKIVRMWAMTPKVSELQFNPDNTVTFFPNTTHKWTLAFELLD